MTRRRTTLGLAGIWGLVGLFYGLGGLSACSDDSGGTKCVPQEEQCNGLDDDCDGQTDEGSSPEGLLQQPCQSACGEGHQVCVNGQWTECDAPQPQQEVCDGLDNDCDGQTDEGGPEGHLRKACQTACGTGYQTCVDGQWGDCDAPKPEQEVCDGVDNDCNGQTDEVCECKVGETRPCGSNVGECRQGIEHCVDGHWSGQCEGGIQPKDNDGTDPSLCNGQDDDCDGDTDEDCQCTPGTTQDCGTDVGTCKKGTQTCVTGGTWGPCQGSVDPVEETCDGTDNDCDGEIDEGINPFDLDQYEANNNCQTGVYTDLGSVDEGTGPTQWTAALYPGDDVDWYKIHVEEADHLIWCGISFKPQCFWSEFTFTLPEGLTPDDVVVTLYADDDGQCGGNQQSFASTDDPTEWDGNTWTLDLQWEGQCGLDDSWDFFVKVEYANPTTVHPACQSYSFSIEMGFFDQCENGCDSCNP